MNQGIYGLTAQTAMPPRRFLGRPTAVPTITTGASGFDPRDIAGLELFLDASDEETLGPTSAWPGQLVNGGAVKHWRDKSGFNRHATQTGADSAAPTFAPASLNGRTTLTFGGSAWMGGRYTGRETYTAQTFFFVARMSSSASLAFYARLFGQASEISYDYQTTGHYIPALRVQTTGNLASFASSLERAIVTPTLDRWFVFSSRHTGAQIQNSLNNAAQLTYSHTLNATFTRYFIATDQLTAYWRDGIAEILMYSRSLTDTERAAVTAYLGSKWGITLV